MSDDGDESAEKLKHDYGNKYLTPFVDAMTKMVTGPAVWFREKIVENGYRQDYPWYHKRYRRVPTIDECYMDDVVCREEANLQLERDRMVEDQIICILNKRLEECVFYNYPSYGHSNHSLLETNPCFEIRKTRDRARLHHYIKYGDLRARPRVEDVFMKQKHRMIWERRHGPVGTGPGPKSSKETEIPEEYEGRRIPYDRSEEGLFWWKPEGN